MPKKVSYYRRQADKRMQEWGRRTYTTCLICPKPIVCLHHYYPKSTSSALRYDKENLIPICVGHHFSHHNGNPEIHNTINEIMGKEWIKRLQKNRYTMTKASISYYKEQAERYLNY